MLRGQLIDFIKDRAVEYRAGASDSLIRNSHMNNLGGECRLTQDEIDALLTDFVNFCGVHQCIDYAMYASDLSKESEATSPT